MTKLIVVVGATGNQGGSVAHRFLQDPNYCVRGLTRNPDSANAKALAAKGAEIVKVDLDDPSTLTPAFEGANLIFSVTNYWEPFFRPDCALEAKARGINVAQFAYEVERRHGINVADAAAQTVDSLDDNGFIVSTLSAAKKCSGGRWTDAYHFDSKSDVFPDYVDEKYPELAKKMSCVQTGVFMTSFRLALQAFLHKKDESTYLTRFPMSPTKRIQHLDVNADTGPFVHAVSQMPPGKSYMAAGTTCTWPEYSAAWSKATGKRCTYEQVTLEQFVALFDWEILGREIGVMFAYSDDPGYDGGEALLGFEDLRKAGVDCPMTSLDEFMGKLDWTEVFDQR